MKDISNNTQFNNTNSSSNEQKCPMCSQILRRFESNYTKEVLWLCLNERCAARFTDNKGAVGDYIPPKDTSSYIACPECNKEHAVHRCKSSKTNDSFFWVCSKCNLFFRDNEGKIGDKFPTN